MLKPEACQIVLVRPELSTHAHHVGKLKGRRKGPRLGLADMRQQSYANACFHVRPNPSRTFDEPEHRRKAEFPYARMRCLTFVNIPVGHMRFAHNSEMETPDFPPRPVGVPDRADICLRDVVVGHATGDLQAKLIGASSG